MFNENFNTANNNYWTPTLFTNFNQIQFKLKKKLFNFKEIFAIALFFLFFGFVFGNLFGTFLNKIRNFELWDGFIVLFLILFIEIINFSNYSTKNSFSKKTEKYKEFSNKKTNPIEPMGKSTISSTSIKLNSSNFLRKDGLKTNQTVNQNYPSEKNFQNLQMDTQDRPNSSNFWKFFNYFKIGLQLGFFVDAFKVGS